MGKSVIILVILIVLVLTSILILHWYIKGKPENGWNSYKYNKGDDTSLKSLNKW